MENIDTAETVPAQKSFDKDKILLTLKAKNPLILAAVGLSLLIFVILAVILVNFLVSGKKYTQPNSVSTNTVNTPLPKTVSSVPSASPQVPVATQTPTSKPTPRPLPTGPQQYAVNSRNNPEVKTFDISSLDTKVGDSQKMSITIQGSPSPVSSVTVKLITDNKSTDYPLTQSSGSNTSGVWSGTLTANDTHDTIYQATVTVKYQTGNNYSFTASFR